MNTTPTIYNQQVGRYTPDGDWFYLTADGDRAGAFATREAALKAGVRRQMEASRSGDYQAGRQDVRNGRFSDRLYATSPDYNEGRFDALNEAVDQYRETGINI